MVLRCDLANRYNPALASPNREHSVPIATPYPTQQAVGTILSPGRDWDASLRATRNSMSDVSYTLLIIASGVAVAFLTFAVLGVE
jgi:hypothetical protein